MNINWYPGHMTKARRMMEENIKLVDVVIELLDARAPLSTRNPDIDDLAKNKFRLILLNKSDMADPKDNEKWEAYFNELGLRCVLIDSRNRDSIKNIDMLFEITASVYAMLFKKLNMQQFNEMIMKKGKPGTISAELSRMYYLSDNRFNYNSDYETIHKCMQELIRNEASSSHGSVEVVDNE